MIHSTVGTLHLRIDDQAAVAAALLLLNRRDAWVGPLRGRWLTIYDPSCLYEDQRLTDLGQLLSERLGCWALVVWHIKYNRLETTFWESGREAVGYQLDLDHVRGDPSPEKIDKAAAGVAERLLPLCRPGTSLAGLDRSLRALAVSSGALESSPEEQARRLPAIEEMSRAFLALPRPAPVSRETATERVLAVHSTTRRDLTAFLALGDEELCGLVDRLRESAQRTAEAPHNEPEQRGRWLGEAAEYAQWLAAGAAAVRSGLRSKLAAVGSDTEAEVRAIIDSNEGARERLRRTVAERPQRVREAIVHALAHPRPQRAVYVLDVWRDLCAALELDYASTREDALVDVEGYPTGFLEVGG